MSELPSAAIANIIPPTLRARAPYHLESHAIRIGKMLERPSPARNAPLNSVTAECAERKTNSPATASKSPPTATVTSFQCKRIAAAAPRPPRRPAKKNIGASAQVFALHCAALCACVGAQEEVPTSVPT